MNKFTHTLLNLGLGVICAFVGSWAIMSLWAWFLVPAGLPAISMLTAFGVDLLVTLLTFHAPRGYSEVEPEEVTLRLWRYGICFPLSFLAAGWLALAIFG